MDKETFLKIIESYLTSSYNTAFMINGSWGSGKTYFWKEVIQKHIEGELSEKRDKPYKVIYIPLYGSTSIQDIKSKLVSEFYILNLKENNIIKDDNQKSILNLITSFIITNESDSLFKKINLQNFDKYEYVLCFDDLERLEENLINECLGFINFLMEHSKIKTFIIANESEIILLDENENNIDKTDSNLEYIKKNTNKLNSNYIKNKEKTIGKKFDFSILDRKEIFKSILLDTKYLEDTKNFNYFINNTNFIDDFYSLFNSNAKSNYRTLFYTLNIIKSIDKYIPFDEVDENLKIKALESIFLFTIAISFESREEYFIKIDKIVDIYSILRIDSLEWTSSDSHRKIIMKENDSVDLLIVSLSSYFFNKEYKGFSSILDFILDGNTFKNDTFVNEVTTYFFNKKIDNNIKDFMRYHFSENSNDVIKRFDNIISLLKEGSIKDLNSIINIADVLFDSIYENILPDNKKLNKSFIKSIVIDSINLSYKKGNFKNINISFYSNTINNFRWTRENDFKLEKKDIINFINKTLDQIKIDAGIISKKLYFINKNLDVNIIDKIKFFHDECIKEVELEALYDTFIQDVLNDTNNSIRSFMNLLISRYYNYDNLIELDKKELNRYLEVISTYLSENKNIDKLKRFNLEDFKKIIQLYL